MVHKLRDCKNGQMMFYCPGCETHHVVTVESDSRPLWQWNGDTILPTFSPSIHVKTGHFVSGQQNKGWCNKSDGDDECDCISCHSFVKNGFIQFLNDCTHSLAGQTVELPNVQPSR